MMRDPSTERQILNLGEETDFDEDLDFEPEPYKKPSKIARFCTFISAKFKKKDYIKYTDGL